MEVDIHSLFENFRLHMVYNFFQVGDLLVGWLLYKLASLHCQMLVLRQKYSLFVVEYM